MLPSNVIVLSFPIKEEAHFCPLVVVAVVAAFFQKDCEKRKGQRLETRCKFVYWEEKHQSIDV